MENNIKMPWANFRSKKYIIGCQCMTQPWLRMISFPNSNQITPFYGTQQSTPLLCAHHSPIHHNSVYPKSQAHQYAILLCKIVYTTSKCFPLLSQLDQNILQHSLHHFMVNNIQPYWHSHSHATSQCTTKPTQEPQSTQITNSCCSSTWIHHLGIMQSAPPHSAHHNHLSFPYPQSINDQWHIPYRSYQPHLSLYITSSAELCGWLHKSHQIL